MTKKTPEVGEASNPGNKGIALKKGPEATGARDPDLLRPEATVIRGTPIMRILEPQAVG